MEMQRLQCMKDMMQGVHITLIGGVHLLGGIPVRPIERADRVNPYETEVLVGRAVR